MGRRLQNGYTEAKNIPFPWDSRHKKSPWSCSENTEQFCGSVMSAVLNENHNTSAHPLKQTHSVTGQAESRPLILSKMQSMLEEPLGEEVLRFEENIFPDRWLQVLGSALALLIDVIIPSNTYMSQSLSATLRTQHIL